ncbi:MAG: hypothetical protein ACQCN4_09720 [Candidatus Bathyarchaeia archaeon]|jgi:hypothetical protein
MQVRPSEIDDNQLRDLLVQVALEWEKRFAVAPRITCDIAEYDAAKLVNTSLRIGLGRKTEDTAVTRGCDFCVGSERYQVKSNRPSGKVGSFVTRVGKAQNFDWDKLIWILYDRTYKIQEAWLFEVGRYRELFEFKNRLSPQDMRKGTRLR